MMQQQQQHEESIYNLIPRPRLVAQKSSRHRSKFSGTTPPTASTFGPATTTCIGVGNIGGDVYVVPRVHKYALEGATMGPKRLHAADPHRYLTSHTTAPLPAPSAFRYQQPNGCEAKPQIVNQQESLRRTRANKAKLTQQRGGGGQGGGGQIDFVRENALTNIMSRPPQQQPQQQQQTDGQPTQQQPKDVNYLQKHDYGKVPAYLSDVKSEMALEKAYIEQVLESERQQQRRLRPQMRLMPEEERVRLLCELKTKWDTVNRQYQVMTHMVALDTHGKIRRKEVYEVELHQLERSIEKLSKPNVYVHDGGDY